MLVEPRAFGGYTVVAQLGSGSTGDAFLALSAGPSGFKKVIVLKVLHAAVERDPDALAAVLDEARRASELRHPNIVQTYEVGEAEGRHFIAMEYVSGLSLERILRECQSRPRLLPVDFCARVAAEVAGALSYVHRVACYDEDVPLDVRPANIVVGWDGTVKVMDLGGASACAPVGSLTSAVTRVRLAYTAPEEAEGLALDQRAGVYSLGAIVFEMLAGKKLVRAAAAPTVSAAPLSELRPDVPLELSDIVALALQENRAERYPSAARMRDDLEAWLVSAGRITRDDIAATLGDYFEGERERQHLLLNDSVEGQPLTSTRTGSYALPPAVEKESAPPGPPVHVEPPPARTPLAPIALAVLVLMAVIAITLGRALQGSSASAPFSAGGEPVETQ